MDMFFGQLTFGGRTTSKVTVGWVAESESEDRRCHVRGEIRRWTVWTRKRHRRIAINRFSLDYIWLAYGLKVFLAKFAYLHACHPPQLWRHLSIITLAWAMREVTRPNTRGLVLLRTHNATFVNMFDWKTSRRATVRKNRPSCIECLVLFQSTSNGSRPIGHTLSSSLSFVAQPWAGCPSFCSSFPGWNRPSVR